MSDTASESFSPPQPTPEHLDLQKRTGTWQVACEFFMGPDAPPMQVEAKETIEAFGPFWTTSLFEADMFGMPFQGRATLGYDAVTKLYESTWCDTMTSSLFRFQGTKSGNVIEMKGQATDHMSGQQAQYRTREEEIGENEFVFEMFMQLPGQPEMPLMRNRYTR